MPRRTMARRTTLRAVRTAALGVAAMLIVTACASNEPATTDPAATSTGTATMEVTSTSDACELSATQAPAGTLVFRVTNRGTDVTEFYLLADDGQRIVGEVENVGPGITRDLVVTAVAGTYVTACKPGMAGEGISADFVVTASGAAPATSEAVSD